MGQATAKHGRTLVRGGIVATDEQTALSTTAEAEAAAAADLGGSAASSLRNKVTSLDCASCCAVFSPKTVRSTESTLLRFAFFSIPSGITENAIAPPDCGGRGKVQTAPNLHAASKTNTQDQHASTQAVQTICPIGKRGVGCQVVRWCGCGCGRPDDSPRESAITTQKQSHSDDHAALCCAGVPQRRFPRTLSR